MKVYLTAEVYVLERRIHKASLLISFNSAPKLGSTQGQEHAKDASDGRRGKFKKQISADNAPKAMKRDTQIKPWYTDSPLLIKSSCPDVYTSSAFVSKLE